MTRITFTKNWNNKLNCNYFTTIRKDTGYHTQFVGKQYDVILKEKPFCKAKLDRVIQLKDMCDSYLDAILKIDTALEREDSEKLFKRFGYSPRECVLLCFRKEAKE